MSPIAEVDRGVPVTRAVVLGSFGSCMGVPQVIAAVEGHEGVTVQLEKGAFPAVNLVRGETVTICFDVTGIARVVGTEDKRIASAKLPTIAEAVFGEGKRVLDLRLLHQHLSAAQQPATA